MPRNITLAATLADFFRQSPGRWHDARALFAVAGACGWRARISDVRRAPYGLTIENRQRTVRQPDGTAFTVSEYRLVPPAAPTAPATLELFP